MVADEISFIFSAASFYSLTQYYSGFGLIAEAVILVLVAALFAFTTMRRRK